MSTRYQGPARQMNRSVVPSGGDIKKEDSINTERVQYNMFQLRNMRTYGAINAGILSGFFGMGKLV